MTMSFRSSSIEEICFVTESLSGNITIYKIGTPLRGCLFCIYQLYARRDEECKGLGNSHRMSPKQAPRHARSHDIERLCRVTESADCNIEKQRLCVVFLFQASRCSASVKIISLFRGQGVEGGGYLLR
jgi:hypothetical protein